jgi:uncharacterized protein (DUF2252 family)
MIAAHVLGRPVVMRELAPQDLKVEVEQFSRKEAVQAAAYLAYIVGVAHAGQMTVEQRQKWHKQLVRRPAGNLNAPSWFWTSVVDLAACHEAGYLEHCRKYALAA